VLVPLLASQTLDVGAGTFGLLSAAFGLGALAGALATASMREASPRVFVGGAIGFSLAMLGLAVVHSVDVALVLLLLLGMSFAFFTSSANALVQLASPAHLRGRVMSLYLFAFAGLAPIGGLVAGFLAELGGTELAFGLAGVDPYRMLHGNPIACERALRKAALTWDDIAVIEVNEAFASVVLQFLKDTGLHERWEAGDVNPNGSGISLGHPLGATGARITATLVSELDRREARYGVASMCIGQGQAIAAVVERL